MRPGRGGSAGRLGPPPRSRRGRTRAEAAAGSAAEAGAGSPPPGPARPCRGSARRAGLGWAGLGWAGPGRARRGGGRAGGAQSARRGGSGALSAAAAERGRSSPPAPRRASPFARPRLPPRLPSLGPGLGLGSGPGPAGGSPPPLRRRAPAGCPPPPPPPPAAVAAAPGHVDAAVVWLHAGAGRLRLRGATARREPGKVGPVPLVAAGLRPPAQERERPEGQGRGGFPPRQLPRALQDPGEPPVLPPQPPQAAAALAEGSLRGSRETAGQTLGRRRQIPRPPKIPFAPHHLGRRGNELLLQGEIPGRAAGMVRPQPLPVPPREAGVGGSHRSYHHPGQQLVQEPEAAGPSGGGEGKGEHGKQQRGHQQTEPTLASGWEQTSHVQLRGRVFSSTKPGSELGPALAGESQPRQELRLLPERLSRISDPSQPPKPPAPGLAAGTPHVQPGGSGILKACGAQTEDRERRFCLETEALGCT